MSPSKTLLAALGLCAAGCTHLAGASEDAMRSYARALEEGRLEEAWALSAPLDQDQFVQRYSDPAVRHQRAEAVSKAAEGGGAAGISLEGSPNGWRVVELPAPRPAGDAEQQARQAVDRFLTAAERGDFETVLAALSASWRARYSAERLKADFAADPIAAGRLGRIRAALAGRWELTAQGPELPLGDGKRLKLLREGEALKVAALE